MKFNTRYFTGRSSITENDLVEAILYNETSLTYGEIEILYKKTEILGNMIQYIVTNMASQDIIDFASYFDFDVEDE